MTSTPNNGSAPRWPTDDAERVQDQEREANGYPPLPEEWEELIDHDTKHRFFANHKTRQTSWTDPRDKLVTVNLVKGGKGLGIGISGAKVCPLFPACIFVLFLSILNVILCDTALHVPSYPFHVLTSCCSARAMEG